MTDPLTPSLEDYLETIYRILRHEPEARCSEISDRMGVNRTSVTGAMRVLRDHALVHYAPYGKITLTDEGRHRAEDVMRRHEALRDFLIRILLLAPDEAEKAACGMEHAITRDIAGRILGFMAFMDQSFPLQTDWRDAFAAFCAARGIGHDSPATATALENAPAAQDATPVPSGPQRTLADLSPGQEAIITDVTGDDAIQRRLLDMGVTPGTPVMIERVAPLGDPLDIRIRGFRMSLRKSEAARLTIQQK